MRSWLSVFYTDAKSKKGRRHTDCSIIIQLSNKMDNSLLAVRFINHKYIVVERILKIYINKINENNENKPLVRVSEKIVLTIPEAAALSNIGQNRLDKLLRAPNCPFVIRVGTKKLVKRKEFERFISDHDYIGEMP